LPLLTGSQLQLASRILVSFILYTLYAPHPIAVNPFKSAIFATYQSEREKAVSFAYDGGVSPNEQLVWVLWKILKGDGNDVSDDPFLFTIGIVLMGTSSPSPSRLDPIPPARWPDLLYHLNLEQLIWTLMTNCVTLPLTCEFL
jgi:hypothetical protein